MSPLPNLPRALLVRRMRAAAPELYTALVDAYTELLDARLPYPNAPECPVIARARAALALVEGPAHGK